MNGVVDKKKVGETIAKTVSIEPLLLKLETNPEPSDWALLLSYYRLVHHSINLIRSDVARIAIVKKVEEFKNIASNKLKGVADITIHEGVPYLIYEGEKIPLGFTDIWSIMATRDSEEAVRKTVEMIYKKHKGEIYNTKYYPV